MTRQILFVLAAAITLAAQSQPSHQDHEKDMAAMCPMHEQHMKNGSAAPAGDASLHEEPMKQMASGDQQFAEMAKRGAVAMGFDQFKTTHHFRTLPDGGAIEVTVNDPADTVDLEAIRHHLRLIAGQFAQGDFSAARMTHDEMPDGADTMIKRREKLRYDYQELPNGAMVRIATKDRKALQAVREFLGYQIREHRTGDALPPNP